MHQFFEPIPSEATQTDSQPLITLSLSQALLILIEKYDNDLEKRKRLEKLYLSGICSQADERYITYILNDSALAEFNVACDFVTINNDPTRRYFETHLAFHSMRLHGSILNETDIEDYFNHIYGLIPVELRQTIDKVLNGSTHESLGNLIPETFAEYPIAFNRIQASDYFSNIEFKEINQSAKKKFLLLLKCSLCAVVVAHHRKEDFPLVIYDQGFFIPKNRGRIAKKQQGLVTSNFYGILKAQTAIPIDDIVYREEPFSYLRPADKSYFVTDAAWTKENEQFRVHPSVTAISGSILTQLRCCKYFLDKQQFPFNNSEKFKIFLRSYISTLMFHLGGHTLFEYVRVLKIEEIQSAFQAIEDFDTLDLDKLYYSDEINSSFQIALSETIKFNKNWLTKKRLHLQITSIPDDQSHDLEPIYFQDEKEELKHEIRHLIAVIKHHKESFGEDNLALLLFFQQKLDELRMREEQLDNTSSSGIELTSRLSKLNC